MTDVSGFRGLRFAQDRVGSLDETITPPFDVISPEQRAELGAKSPHNMSHVILPQPGASGDRYEEAARLLREWRAEGVMTRDEEDSFYLLEQRFTGQSGRDYVRRGFYAKVKLPEEGEQIILGHEKTFPHKIKDRFALTRATQTYFGGIFGLYNDPEQELKDFTGEMDRREPDAVADTIDGVTQRFWHVPANDAVTEFFKKRTIYIADGHHRFATAVAYRDECRKHETTPGPHPYDYLMMGLVAFEDPGLIVRPAHRVLDPPAGFDFNEFRTDLEAYFDVKPVTNGLAQEVKESSKPTVGVALNSGEQYLLTLKDIDRVELLGSEHGPAWRNLDVSLLHGGIFEKLMGLSSETEFHYEPDASKALGACRDGDHAMTCLLNPVSAAQIQACADAGEFMPQKATYLFPKLPTGGVIFPIEA